MNMSLYRRIPKNLWQRVWFWLNRDIAKNVRYYDSGFVQYQDYNGYTHSLTKDWFEANYEPVDKPMHIISPPPGYIVVADQLSLNNWDVKDHNADAGKSYQVCDHPSIECYKIDDNHVGSRCSKCKSTDIKLTLKTSESGL